jgi:hypothetical protein
MTDEVWSKKEMARKPRDWRDLTVSKEFRDE